MKFIDHTGHIFELTDYTSYPIGFEYETHPYVFWLNGEYQNKISVKNYFVLPIRFVGSNMLNIEISVDSSIYKFYKGVNNELQNPSVIGNNSIIELSETTNGISNFTNNISLENDDINKIEINETTYLYTFYIFGISDVEGTWLSNVLIKFTYLTDNITETKYCPITVGGTFIDEIEELKINARNFGVKLPKDILKAIYTESYLNDEFNSVVYNTKLKEYLMNYMILRGECGNYNSALAALKWFGWGDKINISKLLKTDNEIKTTFIHDYFNIFNDINEAYKNFKQSTYLTLHVNYNQETGLVYDEKYNSETGFYSEGNPILENLFDKTVNKYYDEGTIEFIRGYYECNLQEMMFKLSCLAHMYKKYFLPIHLSVKNSGVRETVFANNIKFLTNYNVNTVECPVFLSDQINNIQTHVKFNENNTYFLHNKFGKNNETFYIDSNYIYTSEYTRDFCKNSENTFYNVTNSIHVEIPILFSSKNDMAVYNCVLLFSKTYKDSENKIKSELLKESHFTVNKTGETDKISFIIAPCCFKNTYDISFWENNNDDIFTIDLLCNGKWYKYNFYIKVPEFNISFAKLQYTYDFNLQRQLNSISDNALDFNAHIFEPGLVQTNNVNFYETLINAISVDNMFFEFNDDFNDDFKIPEMLNYFINSVSDTVKINNNTAYLNRIKVYDIYDSKGKKLRYKGNYIASKLNENEKFITTDVINMYNTFFKTNEANEIIYNINSNNSYLHRNYDFYLMHDGKYYFGVLISKDTIGNPDNKWVLDTEELQLSTLMCENTKQFALRLYRSSDVFLINRMKLVYPTNNTNHFTKDDIIVSKINNIDFPYILSRGGSKWEYNNISYVKSSYKITPVYSKTNTGIMSVDDSNKQYAPGYYDVIVNYAVDDFETHNRTLKTRILIKK